MRQLMCSEPARSVGECLFFALADGARPPVLPGGLYSHRLLDRFHLVQESCARLREALLSGFFDAIAEQYLELVDPQRNLENIRFLVDWLVGDLRACPGTLIDLGCGTGASRGIIERTGRSVVGVEAAPRMRALAESAGMTVVGPDGVATLPIAAGAIASYVLHLDPMPRELPALLARLRDGASLVANLHKGRGLCELGDYVRAIGAAIEYGPCHGLHGRYVRIHAG